MNHAFITIAIPFAVRRLHDVDVCLGTLADPEQGNRPQPAIADALDDIAIIHYMSIVAVNPVCPATRSEDPRDRDTADEGNAHLMIEIAADGGVDEVLAVLGHTLGGELDSILAAANVDRKSKSIATFLRQHHWRIGAGWTAQALGQIHTGSPGMSVRRIRQERELAQWIGDKIDAYRKEDRWRGLSPPQRLDWIRRDLWNLGDSKWAFVEEPAPVLPADPANPWNDSGYDVNNPQALKALAWILHTLLWPLYVPFALVWLWLSAPAWQDGPSIHAVMWPAAVFFWLFVVLVLSGLYIFVRLRRQEQQDHADDRVPPSEQVAALMKQENFDPGAQNHMATISRLKPGWVRRLTLRIAFIVVGSGRFVGAPGFLGKNGVIHFARWMRLPGTTQLLFWSNFDNTWESYVADFIADAPSGVTAIWSNCRGFPRTQSLFGKGAEDHDRLVPWARRQQQPTLLWYSAYPDLTADRVRKNAAIRQGIASAASDADVRDWFALFGSAPRPADAIDLQEIPTLVFGGLSNRPFAECQIVRWNDDAGADGARAWLSRVAVDATYGETLPAQDTAVAVALAATALRRLELPEDALASFPTAFQQGIWPEWRARELGDVDDKDKDKEDAPAGWRWGGNEIDRRADALVLIYADEEKFLKKKSAEFREDAARYGHDIVCTIPLTTPKPRKRSDGSLILPQERFGFADGVSQPVILGAPRKNTRAVGNDLVAPGEIVLGYPDNTGKVPPSPLLADKHDPKHYLPDRGPDPFRRRPEFSRYEGTSGERDLGANGTFLVVRQLDQKPGEFRRWVDETYEWLLHSPYVVMSSDGMSTSIESQLSAEVGSTAIAPDLGQSTSSTTMTVGASGMSSATVAKVFGSGSTAPTTQDTKALKELIAAKLVGRWQDGSSLVRNPQFPASKSNPDARPDNAFMLGTEDPRGLSCPFGSHIRRANPRDTRFHSTPEESRLEVEGVNRHRILRIGRAYTYTEEVGDAKVEHTGLLFMCLNADIERQFEFIQKTWLLNRNIHGLEDEGDPIMSCGPRNFTIPTSNGPLRIPINRNFVRVMGGGYFFMPGRAAMRYLTRGTEPRSHGPFGGRI